MFLEVTECNSNYCLTFAGGVCNEGGDNATLFFSICRLLPVVRRGRSVCGSGLRAISTTRLGTSQ